MNVVILAAGRGERFAIDGISVPKPLIEFRGRTLLHRSVLLADEIAQVRGGKGRRRVIVVATEPVAAAAERLRRVTHVVPVSVTQPGPAASAQLALAHLPDDEPVIVMDCDNYYPSDTLTWIPELPIGQDFIAVHEGVPAGLRGQDFCGMNLSREGYVETLSEKEDPAPSFVATGIYGFCAASWLRGSYGTALEECETEEIPMSRLLGVGTRAFAIPTWHPIGTPDQMRAAAAWRVQSPTSNE